MEPKKRSLGASERDEFLRSAWRQMVAGEVDAERLVFVDEMGTNVSLCPLYAWSRRGKRAFGSAPRNWGKNVTLLASIARGGLGPCMAVEGATTREVFEAYLERVLAPTLSPGQVVVMDNLLRPTRAGGYRRSSRVGAASCSTCRPTRRTIEPHRARVLEDQGALATSRGENPRNADRGDGDGALGGIGEGCPQVLRALWLPFDGSTAMTKALGAGGGSLKWAVALPGAHTPLKNLRVIL